MDEDIEWDVIVVGGGAAGLAGATTLARSRRSVLVVDAGEPRNAPAHAVHSYLGRDGVPPLELLAQGRTELASYGGSVRQGEAVSARVVDRGFEVTLDTGSVLTSRRLLVTTGLVDELPEIPGLRERWGSDVVHCPYCHGWEVRDQPIAVLASGPMAGHQALLFRQLSDDVILLLNGQPEPGEEEARRFGALGIRVVGGPVERVVTDEVGITGVEVGGAVVPCRVVVVGPKMVARSAILERLGVAPEELAFGGAAVATFVPADPMGQTSARGVYVAGNVADPQAQVVTAAGAGVKAAAAINMDLIEEDVARAVGALVG